jgi:hypothetical protein
MSDSRTIFDRRCSRLRQLPGEHGEAFSRCRGYPLRKPCAGWQLGRRRQAGRIFRSHRRAKCSAANAEHPSETRWSEDFRRWRRHQQHLCGRQRRESPESRGSGCDRPLPPTTIITMWVILRSKEYRALAEKLHKPIWISELGCCFADQKEKGRNVGGSVHGGLHPHGPARSRR